jgi:hypothetical protein
MSSTAGPADEHDGADLAPAVVRLLNRNLLTGAAIGLATALVAVLLLVGLVELAGTLLSGKVLERSLTTMFWSTLLGTAVVAMLIERRILPSGGISGNVLADAMPLLVAAVSSLCCFMVLLAFVLLALTYARLGA